MKRTLVSISILILLLSTSQLFAKSEREVPFDQTIKQNIVDQLVSDARVDAAAVEVEVEFGEVTLSGKVPSAYAKDAATDDVWSVAGVVTLKNNLDVEPFEEEMTPESLAASVKDALIISTDVDASGITVVADNGNVTLKGTVDALWKKDRAEEIASGVIGVLGVTNEIAVVPSEDVIDEAIADDIINALDRNVNVNVNNVSVRVSDGFVVLSGTVDDSFARRQAYETAANTIGVKGVASEIQIKQSGEAVPALTDVEIARRVKDQLIWDNKVDATGITVEVADGLTTLAGTVDTYSAKVAAQEDASEIAGVASVQNNLVVEPIEFPSSGIFLANRVEQTLEWSQSVDVVDLRVSAVGGLVTVNGTVDQLWKKEHAEELIRDINGVVGIVDKIAVVPTKSLLDEGIAENILDSIDRNVNINVDDVTVSVENGNVTLTGTVPSFIAKDSAGLAASNTTGVRSVVNDIKIANS